MNWIPKPEWKGQTAFLIGGGSSLRGFNFGLLERRNTIGCNHAYLLGNEIVHTCIFGDPSFWESDREGLEKFKGRVVTCAALDLKGKPVPWLLQMRRMSHGLHSGHLLGWNYSTGAAAINLALSLGVSRIYLLGYDLGVQQNGAKGKPLSHWHDAHPTPPREKAYLRFLRGFHTVAHQLAKHYPKVEVINVVKKSSRLGDLFPSVSLDSVVSSLKKGDL